ncbi:MAG: hypothetical protein GXP39_09745 [Chloroflexi bacterium]|nr:hypothetical protein [Chloroflexota bacterium]
MKRTTWVIAIVVLACLLLAGVVLAQPSRQSGSPTLYTIGPGVASSDLYRLIGVSWDVDGTASGGGYRLLDPSGPALRGNGCCCTYLPCVFGGR